MPPLSLVVCVHKERDLLERLLRRASGCFDDLLVIHDGPVDAAPAPDRPPVISADFSVPGESATASSFWKEKTAEPAPADGIPELVSRHGGRFFEGPRCQQQEPHWPFAWAQARHDWILRLDADEFPGEELAQWLRDFRARPEMPSPGEPSGYTCVWPMWDGKRAVSGRWPDGRIFLFDRRKIRFFGMAEQSPIAEGSLQPLPLILCHQPKRKSYGLRNILFRRQAYRWRRVIVRSLSGSPLDLPRWRWSSPEWPAFWNNLRTHPLRYATRALLFLPLHTARAMMRHGLLPRPGILFQSAVHHFILSVQFWAEGSAKPKRTG